MADKIQFESVDQYINTFPENVQKVLEKIRSIYKKALPEATEGISYNIPTFFIDGKYLVYFAGFAKHISVYPYHPEELPELEKYASGQGTLKFPLDKEIPYDLIEKLVKVKLERRKRN